MEKTLERHLDESCRIPGVIGAICVDQHGLCLASKGEVSTFAAGPVASLAKQASTLNCQSSTCPVIVIESQNGKTIIKQDDGFTTAIFKT